METDARGQMARCLMLAETKKIDQDEVVEHVRALYLEIVEQAFDISLNIHLCEESLA